MGLTSIWHWLILLVVALVVFGGRGKISEIMGDVARGIKSFKKGMADEEPPTKALNTETKDRPAQKEETRTT